MKKLFTLLLLFCAAAVAHAQSLSFTLVTQPCNNNGVLQATATGLTGTVTYTFFLPGQSSFTNTTGTLNNYSGAYVVVQASGSGSGSAYGTYAGSPPFHYTYTTTPAVCPALGTASVAITGGTSPFTVQWMAAGSSAVVATGSTASLPAGNYKVLITDAAGCTFGSYAQSDSIYVQNNSGLSLSTSTTAASCTNGSATVVVTGGVGPYSYQWSNGANTQTITGLVQGQYSVTVTSSQGCSNTAYVYIQQNPQISVNITPTPATCLQTNGAAIAFGSGGVSPYTYSWSNAQSTQSISGIGTGGYSVIATDANGCSGTGYTYINASTPITATYSATPSSCTAATGSATVTPAGGTAPYTIVWNTYPTQTGTTATALTAGTYGFTITDAVGCVRTGTVVVPPVSIINANTSAQNTLCNTSNGSASVVVTSGTPPYSYLWSNGATGTSISGLSAGGYGVQITDALGCHVTKSASVNTISPISLGFSATQASCIYSANGSATVTAFGGTPPYTYSWSSGATTATAANLPTGYQYVGVQDAAGCYKTGGTYIGYNAGNNSCYCTITGTVYNDVNGNCVKDAGEAGIPNIMVHATGFGYTFTNAAGQYSFQVPSGTYILSESVQAYYPLATCQNNAQSVTAVAASGCTTTVNFANTIATIHDMSVQTSSLSGPPVPGHTYYQTVVVNNAGTVTETGVTTGYQHDGQLGAPLFSPSNFVASGTNAYRTNATANTLTAGNNQSHYVHYSVPTNIPLGTSLVYKDTAVNTLPMTNWLNDYSPWNNVEYYTTTVVGSFDPNNKEVYPRGTGTQGYIYATDSILTYTIHFQNTGTYPAQKVVLKDTLSTALVLSSLKMGASNHSYKTSMSESGILTFTFDNINLPDSQSSPLGSIGWVTYTIRQKQNLVIGTQIKNSASIYFDYNAPVKTNTTLNTLKSNLGVGTTAGTGSLSMNVYPNPAKENVTIAIESQSDNGTAQIRFVNLVGQVMLQQQVAMHRGSNLYEAAISNLASGLYFVEVSNGLNKSTTKLSVVR